MANHDLAAELLGYRAELARYERAGLDDKAAGVREQIERVQREIKGEVERLEGDASRYDEAGQGVPAAVARNEARRYRALLGKDEKPTRRGRRGGSGRSGQETATDQTPKETA